jgi:methionine aminotransferase
MPIIKSKLPTVGTTIFTVMTQRAQELGAINLAQGFPDYDAPERLKELFALHVAAGRNQYAPMIGVQELREQIALKFTRLYGKSLDPTAEITITLGATEGIFSAVLALVHAGDEVIVLEPCYDSYRPAIELAGGKAVGVPLKTPEFSIDWDRLGAAISARTRLIILNSPNNPTGAVIAAEDLDRLAARLRSTNTLVLSDEVYEHMVFDDRHHANVCVHPQLWERSVAVYSFGKTMHATGWRVGYTVAPADITQEIRRVHQFNTFSITSPLQYALADFLQEAPSHSLELAAFYQRKRDLFLELTRGSRFKAVPSAGTYFQLLDFSDISQQSDMEFADRLLREVGVASIPLTPFYESAPLLPYVRFCFAKQDSTLAAAAERLCKI